MKTKFLAAFLAALAFAGVAYAQSPATLRPNAFAIDSGTKTATAVAGAATLNKGSGVVTTEALVTAAAASYTLTLTDTYITATDIVMVSVGYGTATTGEPAVHRVNPAAGSATIVIRNDAAAAAFNGTLRISYAVLRGN